MLIAAAILAGLVLLAVGGELAVKGAVRVAEGLGVSPLMIGLTLVGFGTSLPELVTSVQAAFSGAPGLAIGNIVGSNIANTFMIIGIASVIAPIPVASPALKRDGSLMLAACLAFAALGYVMPLDRVVGGLFLIILVGYVMFAWRQEKTGAVGGHTSAYELAEAYEQLREPVLNQPRGMARARRMMGGMVGALLLAVVGFALVIFGARLLVDGSIALARSFGVQETVIGLTIVAIGTSLPELVTSLVAAYRRQSDIALGNVLGSNIYNVLGIGGVTGLLAPTEIPSSIVRFDSPVMVIGAAVLILFAMTGRRITRSEGFVLLACYAAYLTTLTLTH